MRTSFTCQLSKHQFLRYSVGSLVILFVSFISSQALGGTYTLYGHSSDYINYSDGTLVSFGDSARIGRGGNGAGIEANIVYIFRMATVPDLSYRTYTGANLSFEMFRKDSPTANIDLWGVRKSSTVGPYDDFYVGDATAHFGETKIQNNILTPSSSVGTINTNSSGDAALFNYVSGMIGNSSQAYAYFRLNSDSSVTTNLRGYHIRFADTSGTSLDPRITFSYVDAGISYSGITFGNTLVGETRAGSVTVSNNGDSGSILTGSFASSTANPIFSPYTSISSFSLARGASASKPVSFEPLTRGSSSSSLLISSNAGTRSASLTGQGVAPVSQLSILENAGPTRLGTSSTATLRISNIGDGNLSGRPASVSNLLGTAGSVSGLFVGSGASLSLGDGTYQDLTYTFTPTSRGTFSQSAGASFLNGHSSGNNQAHTASVTLVGQGVGPEFSSSQTLSSPIIFDEPVVGLFSDSLLTISNHTSDAGASELVGLTLLGVEFSGTDADQFSVVGFTPGTVLDPGEMLDLSIRFEPYGAPGVRQAMITLITDQNAAFGTTGDSFSFMLQGSAPVPEPGTCALTLLGTLLLRRRRERRRTMD